MKLLAIRTHLPSATTTATTTTIDHVVLVDSLRKSPLLVCYRASNSNSAGEI
jgi:hypothetical protein